MKTNRRKRKKDWEFADVRAAETEGGTEERGKNKKTEGTEKGVGKEEEKAGNGGGGRRGRIPGAKGDVS